MRKPLYALSYKSYLHFHSLKFVTRYRDQQLQVSENNSYICAICDQQLCKYWCLNTNFITNHSNLTNKKVDWNDYIGD